MGRAGIVLLAIVLYIAAVAFFYKNLRRSMNRLLPRKYREATNFTTITQHYTYDDSAEVEDTYVPCLSDCSWEHTLDNSLFKQQVNYTSPFHIDDDQEVKSMQGKLACVPFSFGFSQEKGLDVFPPYEFPPCEKKLTERPPNLTLDTASNEFEMTCDSSGTWKYLLFPRSLSPTGQYLYTDIDKDWKVKDYPKHKVSAEGSEFAFGGCKEELTAAAHIPKFRPEVHSRTQAKMRSMSQGKPIRPQIILFIAIDSFSRRHFYRKLPRTTALLNSLNAAQDFTVFDFKLHNIIGQGSAENMIPVFTNQSFHSYKTVPKGDQLGPTSLWAMLKDMGYTTLLGFEDCDYHFPVYLGDEMDVDHLIRSFYCATFKYLGLKMWSWIHEQRCVGAHMSHYYVMNYTRTFSEMYRGDNQFIYIHLDAAHEETGQHAGTLDPDLSSFIEDYLESFKADNDILVFLQADHGMRYGSWYKDIEAHQESKLPALFFFTQSKVLDRFPGAYDTLWHNSFRLVSQRDLRATILAFAWQPYKQQYPVHQYEPYLDKDYILFQEKIKDSRTCEDAGIPPWCCACLPTTRISGELIHTWGRGEMERVLLLVVNEAIRLMNEQVATPKIMPGVICQKLNFDYIVKAYGSIVGRKTEEIQVEFRVKESLSARFEAFAIIGSDDDHQLMDQSRERNNFVPNVYQDVKVRVRLIDIIRKDKYKGPCEVVSRRQGLKAEYCLCSDLKEMERKYPGLFGEEEK